MKTKVPSPKDYEYFLWVDKSTGKYFAKVKETGEVCELTLKQMRFMRSEEMEIKRAPNNLDTEKFEAANYNAANDKQKVSDNEKNKSKNNNSNDDVPVILSLDALMAKSEAKSSWFEDKTDYAKLVDLKLMEQEFKKLLTEKQLDVYEKCILQNFNNTEYAKLHNLNESTVREHIKSIRRIAKKHFLKNIFA